MDEERADASAIDVAADALAGAGAALDHRVNDLQMGGVGGEATNQT